MKRFNRIFAVCLTLSVLGGSLLPSPWTCGGFTEPVPIEVHADGEPTTIDSGIGVLITMLLANGIRFVGNFDDTVKPGIQKLWDDFTTATGNSVTLATLGAQSVVQLGFLRTSSAVNNAVNAFQQWYTDTYSVANTGSVSIPVASDSGTYFIARGGTTVGETIDKIITLISLTSTSEVRAVVLTDNGSKISAYLVSNNDFTATCTDYNGTDRNIFTTHIQRDGLDFYSGYIIIKYLSNQTIKSTITTPIYTNAFSNGINSWQIYMDAYKYTFGSGAVIGDTSMTGQTLELKDGFNISNDQAKLIDLAGIESLVGTLGLTLENVNDLVDSIPLIMDYPWADTFPDDPAFADTPDDSIPWVDVPTAVVPAEVPEYVPETPADEGSYKVLGLERVFPFSIPFDFIAVVNLLNAEPVCPEFTFRVYNPISGQNIDATMSFERFEAVAQVIRIVETIGFIVFLILITRSLIRS